MSAERRVSVGAGPRYRSPVRGASPVPVGARYKTPSAKQSDLDFAGNRYKSPTAEQPAESITADLKKLKIIARIFALMFALVVVVLLNISLLQTQVLYDEGQEPLIREIDPMATPTSAPGGDS